MLSISKPLSVSTTQSYYTAEYATQGHYFNENDQLRGNWEGKLAATFGLEGQQVRNEHFQNLADGKHPITGELLVRARDTIKTKSGEEVGKRSAWDLTLSPGKSVSTTALVGGDERIILAHRVAVKVTLAEVENLIQAHGGGANPPITTAKMIVATFEHSVSRPVDGYSAAQLHTHAVLFNMTEGPDGQARALQTHEIYLACQMISAIYQHHMELALRNLGYKTEINKNSVEIVGYSKEYLASESLRSKQIADKLAEKGLTGAEAASRAAHSTRESKLHQTPEEIRAMHAKNALKFGNQHERIVAEAAERRAQGIKQENGSEWARKAVSFARVKLSERNSVFDHHEVMAEALRYSRGRASLGQIKGEVQTQKAAGLFIEVQHVRPNAPLWRYTTPEAIRDERYVIEAVLDHQKRSPINRVSDESLAARNPLLNEWQRRIIRESLAAEERITGIQGSAGTGKSFSLSVIRELAHESGWKVYGLAPTSRAARELKSVGIPESETIQRFLLRDEKRPERRLFFMDETSLTAARQLRSVIERMRPDDRMILVGDRRQHDSVLAGRIFLELQLAGMVCARINKLVRQQDPGLREVVKAFAQERTADGVDLLHKQGRITAIEHRAERFTALAKDYAADPEGALVISPDNASREELNGVIRRELRAAGKLEPDAYQMSILVNRQDVTGADRTRAGSYEVGDVIRYRSGSKRVGIKGKSYATVLANDQDANTVTVKTDAGNVVRYNPEILQGVSIYSPEQRSFAVGDRIQFTSPSREQQVSNRDMGTLTHLDSKGNVRVRLDAGRTVGFNLKRNPHVEHGYVSTSHAAQGATAGRLLLHLDTGDTRIRSLVNKTLAYVALSRPKYDARVYCDDQTRLAETLKRHKENSMALSPEQIKEYKVGKGMAA